MSELSFLNILRDIQTHRSREVNSNGTFIKLNFINFRVGWVYEDSYYENTNLFKVCLMNVPLLFYLCLRLKLGNIDIEVEEEEMVVGERVEQETAVDEELLEKLKNLPTDFIDVARLQKILSPNRNIMRNLP